MRRGQRCPLPNSRTKSLKPRDHHSCRNTAAMTPTSRELVCVGLDRLTHELEKPLRTETPESLPVIVKFDGEPRFRRRSVRELNLRTSDQAKFTKCVTTPPKWLATMCQTTESLGQFFFEAPVWELKRG